MPSENISRRELKRLSSNVSILSLNIVASTRSIVVASRCTRPDISADTEPGLCGPERSVVHVGSPSYRVVNTLRLCCKNRSVNAV
jgi:hypothetical protein